MNQVTKVLVVVFATALLVFGAYIVYYYLTNSSTQNTGGTVDSGYSPYETTIAINPEDDTVAVGEEFEVVLYLAVRGEKIAGADTVLYYDNGLVEVQSIETGEVFQDYPRQEDDSEGGMVYISGLAAIDSPFTGSGTVATIKFKALREGTLLLGLYKANTADKESSKVASSTSGNDVLSDSAETTVVITESDR